MKSNTLLIILLLFVSCNAIAQVEKRVFVDKAGTLISNFTEEEANAITHLTITGKINAVDFKHLRNEFISLNFLDLSNVEIKTYAGKEGTYPDKFYVYPPNCIPAHAFSSTVDGNVKGKLSLQHIILSEKIKNIEDAAFKGCSNLKICQIKRKKSPNLLKEALADSITAIYVPLGCRNDYRFDSRWDNFTILEGEPTSVKIQIGALETLQDKILKSGHQPMNINYITIEGKLDNADFTLMRDYMPNLVSIDISKTTATEIPDFIFSHKKYLMTIELPENLKAIGQRAFSGCNKLCGNIQLPSTVNRIDYGAFMGCTNLRKVIVTGEYPTTLGDMIFGEESNKLSKQ